MKTLKNKFHTKTLAEMKVKAAEKIILEAMDENELKQATQIISKLTSLKGKGLLALDSAIEQAETEVNKFTSNDVIGAAGQKLAGLVGFRNPIVKALTFANALEKAFKQIPLIVKNNIQDAAGANKDKTIIAALGDDQKKLKIVKDSIVKALTPDGLFSVFKTMPYVATDLVINDIVGNINIGDLLSLSQKIEAGPKTDSIAQSDDIKNAVQGTAEKTSTSADAEHPEFSNSINALAQKNSAIKKLLDRPDGQGKKLLSQIFNAGAQAKK
jgi:hypothetical protein